MPKVVEISHKRREILDAAIAVFSRYGDRASLDRVAARAGMGKSSLYHYFPNRRSLVAALVDDLLRHEDDLFDAVVARPEPALVRLRTLLETVSMLLGQWAKAGSLVFDFVRDARGRRRVSDTFRAGRSALARLIRDGQRAGVFRNGRPEVLATIVLAVMDGVLLQELIDPGAATGPEIDRAMREAVGAVLAAPKSG